MTSHSRPVDRPSLSRRTFAAALVAGAGLAVVPLAPAVAATPSPSPKLPYEYYRKGNQVSMYAGTLFDDIFVRIQGDAARVFVPQSIKPGTGQPVRVVWLYHGAGSDQTAIDGGFRTTAHRIVDAGAIAICQNAGGTLYSHPTACALQQAGWAWISGIYQVAANVLRATSGGGALACETLGSSLIPRITGMYNVNAVYDLMALYDGRERDRASLVSVFGDDTAAIQASNPARLSQGAWAGKSLRIVVSQPDSSDRVVPPELHGLALLKVAAPVAAEASLRTHSSGHNTPGFADTDFVTAISRWAPAAADTTAPTVAVAAPTAGATLTGTQTLGATASDNTAVTAVTFTITSAAGGTPRTATGTAPTGTSTTWTATLDTTTLPNGGATITASASDAAGNTTTSAPVSATITNADTTAPAVSITSPAPSATISGSTTAVAVASDNVGVVSVRFFANGRLAGSGVLSSGAWRFGLDTRRFANGSYSLTAVAADAAGNSTTSAAVPVTVRN